MQTPEPWEIEFDEAGGYDCMTCAIDIGPAVLDGIDYGQEWCKPIPPDGLARMFADARLISAAHDLAKVASMAIDWWDKNRQDAACEPEFVSYARAAMSKIKGE